VSISPLGRKTSRWIKLKTSVLREGGVPSRCVRSVPRVGLSPAGGDFGDARGFFVVGVLFGAVWRSPVQFGARSERPRRGGFCFGVRLLRRWVYLSRRPVLRWRYFGCRTARSQGDFAAVGCCVCCAPSASCPGCEYIEFASVIRVAPLRCATQD